MLLQHEEYQSSFDKAIAKASAVFSPTSVRAISMMRLSVELPKSQATAFSYELKSQFSLSSAA